MKKILIMFSIASIVIIASVIVLYMNLIENHINNIPIVILILKHILVTLIKIMME